MTEEKLAQSLQGLGFRLEPSELASLAQHIGQGQGVRRSTLAAALGDWPTLLQDHRWVYLSFQVGTCLVHVHGQGVRRSTQPLATGLPCCKTTGGLLLWCACCVCKERYVA